MKSYPIRPIQRWSYLLLGFVILVNSLMNVSMGERTLGISQFILFVLWILAFFFGAKDYLLLGDGKLIVNRGALKWQRQFDLDGLTLIKNKPKKLVLLYTKNGKKKKVRIALSMIERESAEQFRKDLKELTGLDV